MIQKYNTLALATVLMSMGLQGYLMSDTCEQSQYDASQLLGDYKKTNYGEQKEGFKSQLYKRQVGLMKYDEYMSFIEPYLQEAEQALKIVQFLKTDEGLSLCNDSLCDDYFYHLLNYNVSYFHNYVNPSDVTKQRFNEHSERLHSVIKQIQECCININGLDVEDEFAKTIALFEKANKAYYKKLSFSARSLLWLLA